MGGASIIICAELTAQIFLAARRKKMVCVSSVLVRLLFFLCLVWSSHCWWPFSSVQTPDAKPQLTHTEESGGKEAPAKFEVTNAEQKFLAEAHSFLNLSPLEKCQHSVSMKNGPLIIQLICTPSGDFQIAAVLW